MRDKVRAVSEDAEECGGGQDALVAKKGMKEI